MATVVSWGWGARSAGASCVREGPAEARTAPGFAPANLLDGDFPTEQSAELALLLHGELRRHGAIESALDLRLGEAFTRLAAGQGWRHLGHSRPSDYALGRFGFSWSHARELIALATKLPALPVLRDAFLSGAIGRANLRLVVSVATPETDALLAQACRRLGVRALKCALPELMAREGEEVRARAAAAVTAASAPEEASDEIALRTSSQHAALVRTWGLPMVRAVLGADAPPWKCLEALAADAQAGLGGAATEERAPEAEPGGACTEGDAPAGRRRGDRSRAARLRSRRQARKAARAARRDVAVLPLLRLPSLEDARSPCDVHAGPVPRAPRVVPVARRAGNGDGGHSRVRAPAVMTRAILAGMSPVPISGAGPRKEVWREEMLVPGDTSAVVHAR
jgi:hypothetical protein